jgi:uncharacterized membrane protein
MDWLYQVLASVGYRHPLHPPFVHLPIGMVMGALLFQLLAILSRATYYETTARHCIALALIALPLAVMAGLLDWHQFYAGAWLLPVKIKMIMAGVLLGALVGCLMVPRWTTLKSQYLMALYGVPLLLVAGLGYFGGELVYGNSRRTDGVRTASQVAGEQSFRTNCGSCHPDGGNTLKPKLPLRGAPQLTDERVFVEYLRNPKARDGATTLMPAFPKDRLSDGEALQIRRYVIEVLRPKS